MKNPAIASTISRSWQGCESWNFTVRSTIRDRMTLRFDGVSGVPPEFDVLLIDPRLQTTQDLREWSSYEFASPGGDDSRSMELVVGLPEFVQQAVDARVVRPSAPVLFHPFRSDADPASYSAGPRCAGPGRQDPAG